MSEQFYVVEHHGCGGQMCVPYFRTFESKNLAGKFIEDLERQDKREGHSCKDYIEVYISQVKLGNGFGFIVPDGNADDHEMPDFDNHGFRRSYVNKFFTRIPNSEVLSATTNPSNFYD